jgi:hypothetical protein
VIAIELVGTEDTKYANEYLAVSDVEYLVKSE